MKISRIYTGSGTGPAGAEAFKSAPGRISGGLIGVMKKFAFCLILLMPGAGWAAGDKPAVKTVLFPFRETVIAARVDSILQPYRVRIGEPFKTGEVLVALDDARFLIEVKRADEQYDFARATYEDRKKLHEQNFTSDYELRRAEFDYRQSESNLADARLNLSFCTVKAPFAGKIVEIMTREYETVRPGQPLCRIIDDNQLLAVMNVPMNDRNLTGVGNPVSIRITDSALTAAGKIYEVTPQADHRTGTVRIRVLIDNAEGTFTAGMTGELVYGK